MSPDSKQDALSARPRRRSAADNAAGTQRRPALEDNDGVGPGQDPVAGPMTVELRAWTGADADSLRRAALTSDDLWTQFGDSDLSSVQSCREVIKRHLALSLPSVRNFAVSWAGRAVGNVGVSHIEHRHDTAWAHYWLTSEARGQGLATRALATAAAWAFSTQDVFRLELGHRVNNPASCRVALRAGFPAEGVERLKLKQGPHRFDVETHARLRTDPSPRVSLLPIA